MIAAMGTRPVLYALILEIVLVYAQFPICSVPTNNAMAFPCDLCKVVGPKSTFNQVNLRFNCMSLDEG